MLAAEKVVTGLAKPCSLCRMRDQVTTTSSMAGSVAADACAGALSCASAHEAPSDPETVVKRMTGNGFALRMIRSLAMQPLFIVKPEDVGKCRASQFTLGAHSQRVGVNLPDSSALIAGAIREPS
jgi:hypothetical protein